MPLETSISPPPRELEFSRAERACAEDVKGLGDVRRLYPKLSLMVDTE
jgi:hypothetical protein